MNQRFKVDLRGIIDLAANHMYTSPDVFVREAIQNAIDAITARTLIEPEHTGSIRLELTIGEEGQPGSICIADNGIGLTVPEVHEFLSTVGASSKREDAEEMAERLASDGGGFLGRFGIGLLSCFMVTDEIVVVTRSARDRDAPAVEWRGRSDGGYTVRELDRARLSPGTSVHLTAKEDAAEYYEFDRLAELAQQYGEMLPTPIVVSCEGSERKINRGALPWSLDERDDVAADDLCQHSLGFRPLDAFRITAPAGGVQGWAFIRPDRSSEWGGTHRLYASGMYVSDRVFGLVPQWATFVACILNATGLRLTASREGVHQGVELDASREEIGAAIRSRLVHLLRRDSEKFGAVMAVHDTDIRGLAVKDDQFFDVIIDLLEFGTTLGNIRFGEFRREHDRLLLARTAEQYRRLSTVAPASGLRVFNGGYTYHEELLCRAAERHPDLEVRSFDAADIVDLWPEPADASAFDRLVSTGSPALGRREVELVVREFEPATLPAYFALGLDAEFHRQLDRTKSMASGLWNEILDAMAPRPESLSPTRLCLNSRSTLVRRLARLSDTELQRTGVEVLFVQALMNGQHALLEEEVAMLNNGLERLLALAAGAE